MPCHEIILHAAGCVYYRALVKIICLPSAGSCEQTVGVKYGTGAKYKSGDT
jgi:hypothetical protein